MTKPRTTTNSSPGISTRYSNSRSEIQRANSRSAVAVTPSPSSKQRRERTQTQFSQAPAAPATATKPSDYRAKTTPMFGLPEDLLQSIREKLDNLPTDDPPEFARLTRVCARSMMKYDTELACRMAEAAQRLHPTAEGEENLERARAIRRGEPLGPLSEAQEKAHAREFRESMKWLKQWAARSRADARAKRGAGR